MASKTYKARALVLRKTKLAEKDLIVTMLDESGALLKGVAKGARKPGGSLAARLEPFSCVNVLMAQGRSLDVVCEARLEGPSVPEFGLEQAACAAPVAELLSQIAQPDLQQLRLFDLSRAAFAHISACGDDPSKALSITAASLWKAMAQVGFRPSFSACVACGRDCREERACGTAAISLEDGGVVCQACRRPADAVVVDANVIGWCEALIAMRFAEVVESGMPVEISFSVLHLVRAWIRAHSGRDVKSLDFLFTCGLF